MHAAVLVNTQSPLEIIELEIPPLKRGQVLVKLDYSGICHSQIMEVDGLRGPDKYLPHLLGHEGCGTVLEIGEDVKKIRAGDQVILTWIKGDGIDAGGTQYVSKTATKNLPKGSIINSGAVTTFSSHSVVSENRCVLMPKEMDKQNAALFGCALPTGAGIVFNELKPNKNEPILILGLGGIGMSALIAAKALDCKPIVAVDIESKKLQEALSFGADYALPLEQFLNDDSWADFCNTNKLLKEFKWVVEAAGKTETIELAFKRTLPKIGVCTFASHPAHGAKIKLDPYDFILGKKLFGSWGGNTHPDRDIKQMHDAIAKQKINLSNLLSKPFSLNEVNAAIDQLRQRKHVRVILKL